MNFNRFRGRIGMALVVGLSLALVAGGAFAQTAVPVASTVNFASCSPSAGGVLDNLANQFGGYTTGWMSQAQTYALNIFAALAGLEFAWWGIQMLLKRRDLEDLLASMFLKCLSLMFFYLVMIHFAPTWVPVIVSSFLQIGQGIGGSANLPTLAGSNPLGTMLSPSSVMGVGMCLAGQVIHLPAPSGLADAVIYGLSAAFASTMLVIAYAIVALTLLLAIIEAYIVVGAGLVMLGFMGSRWTSAWGEKYFGYAVSMGVKLMVTYLVVGLGQTIISAYVISTGANVLANAQASGGGASGSDFAGLCMAALIFAGLAWNVPKLASSFLNGQPSMGMGDMMAPAAMAGAAAMGAVGLAAAGAGAGAKGALNALKSLTSGATGGSGGASGAGTAAADGLDALSSLTSGASGSGSSSGLSGAASSASSGAGASGGSSAGSSSSGSSSSGSSSSASPSALSNGAAGSGGGASASPAAASVASPTAGGSAGEASAADNAPSATSAGADSGAQGTDSPVAGDTGTTDAPSTAGSDAPLSPSASTSAPQTDTLPGVQSTGTEDTIGGAPSAATNAPGAQDKPKPSALVNALKTTGQAMQNSAKTATDVTRKIANQIEGHDGSVSGISIRLGHLED